MGEAAARRYTFFGQYIQRYLNYTIYEWPKLNYAQPFSLVEGLKIETAYANPIEVHFGNHFAKDALINPRS